MRASQPNTSSIWAYTSHPLHKRFVAEQRPDIKFLQFSAVWQVSPTFTLGKWEIFLGLMGSAKGLMLSLKAEIISVQRNRTQPHFWGCPVMCSCHCANKNKLMDAVIEIWVFANVPVLNIKNNRVEIILQPVFQACLLPPLPMDLSFEPGTLTVNDSKWCFLCWRVNSPLIVAITDPLLLKTSHFR